MKRFLFAAAVAVALPLTAVAQAPTAAADADLPVAMVNGEAITSGYLDFLWNRLPEKTRQQWTRSGGGKAAYLEQYVLRRLIIQEAAQKGLDQRPEVRDEVAAARDSALFDAWVRETVTPKIATEEVLKTYYAENMSQFAVPERAKLRIIAISTARRTAEEARGIAARILVELFSARNEAGAKEEVSRRFAAAAERYSDHPSARMGGEIGWADPSALEGSLAEAAHSVAPGMVSGVLEMEGGYAILMVEERRPAGVLSFAEAHDQVRQKVLAASTKDIIDAAGKHSMELRGKAKVQVLPENIH